MLIRLAKTLVGAGWSYARIAWWGLASPRFESRPLVVLQGVIFSDAGILLAVRSDLRGWELPGGELEAGESAEEALRREIREETGARIHVEHHVGDYVRTGFRPHTARVYRCRFVQGPLRTNVESRRLAWFGPDRLPDTLFPWYRTPIADALAAGDGPVQRSDHQGWRAILAGLRIDLRMRYSDDEAGRLP